MHNSKNSKVCFPEPKSPWVGADLRLLALSQTPAEASRPQIRG